MEKREVPWARHLKPFRHDALCRNTSMSPRAASVYGVVKMAWMAMYMKQCSQQYERPIKKIGALYQIDFIPPTQFLANCLAQRQVP